MIAVGASDRGRSLAPQRLSESRHIMGASPESWMLWNVQSVHLSYCRSRATVRALVDRDVLCYSIISTVRNIQVYLHEIDRERRDSQRKTTLLRNAQFLMFYSCTVLLYNKGIVTCPFRTSPAASHPITDSIVVTLSASSERFLVVGHLPIALSQSPSCLPMERG